MSFNSFFRRNLLRIILLSLICSVLAFGSVCDVFASSADVNVTRRSHPTQFANCAVFDGIDVSTYNEKINWAQVKKAGIDFAIIRLGFTYYGRKYVSTNLDDWFERNYENARANGVMVGVYYYSAATTKKEAEKEAKFVLKKLNGRELDLPIACDAEFPPNSRVSRKYYSWSASTRRAKLTDVSLAFMNYIEKNSDYDAMFYSYRGIMDSSFSDGYKYKMKSIDSKFPVWIAQYSTDLSYSRPYQVWQYTSSGTVPGISGYCDCNFWYFDKGEQAKAPLLKTSIAKCKIKLSSSYSEYTGNPRKPSVTIKTANGKILKEGKDYTVSYLKNVKPGTAYAMITGKGKYAGRTYKTFTVGSNPLDPTKVMTGISYSSCTYNGKEHKPNVVVKYDNVTLEENIHYTLEYKNNIKPGTATLLIKGIDEYSGVLDTDYTYEIEKANTTFSGSYPYNVPRDSEPFELDIEANSNGALSYTCSNSEIASVNKNGIVTLTGKPGTCKITVTSEETSQYKSRTKTVSLTVNKTYHKGAHEYGSWITKSKVSCTTDGVKYKLCAICLKRDKKITKAPGHKVVTDPKVAPTCEKNGLTEGSHCSVCNEKITAQAKIPATGHSLSLVAAAVNPTCTKDGATAKYKCSTCGFIDGGIKVSATGHNLKEVVLKAATRKQSGKTETKCKVCGYKASSSKVAPYKEITLLKKAYAYSGKVRKPKVLVKDLNGNVIGNNNYKVSYDKGCRKVGKYTVTITFKNKYKGKVVKHFTINPKDTSITGFKSLTNGFVVKYKKQNVQTSGYQIRYSTTASMKSARYVKVTRAGKTSKKITKLKKNKRYYIQIRTYKNKDGKTFFSNWSKVKTVKTK